MPASVRKDAKDMEIQKRLMRAMSSELNLTTANLSSRVDDFDYAVAKERKSEAQSSFARRFRARAKAAVSGSSETLARLLS